MAATASVRDLRNRFPAIRKLVEAEGEVIVTDQGTPRYRILRYTPAPAQRPAPKNYMRRMRRHQPRPLGAAAARALDQENRGER
jgi:antitoxin (DNA-binding transcriptional repressor) of toxin-antitoxin stability system